MLLLEEYTKYFMNFFKNKKNKAIFTSVFLTGFLSYFLLMIDGYVNPDGLIEGKYYYTNENWALANGRWATRYLNLLIGHNIVIPHIIVMLYCLCIGLSVILLAKLFNINKTSYLILTSAIMIASPSVIAQLPFLYMALCYAVAFLGAVSYCYMIRSGGGIRFLLGVAFMTISMGLYQSYLGAAALLVMLIAVHDLLCGKRIIEVLKQLLTFFVAGIIACVIDLAEFNLEIFLRKTSRSGRVTQFDVELIFTSIGTSVKKAYISFFDYFKDDILKRKGIYSFFGICASIIFLILLIELYKKKKDMAVCVAILICIAVLPIAANIIVVLIPYDSVRLIMCYHYVLVIPFCFSMLEQIKWEKTKAWIGRTVCACICMLVGGYIWSANATFISYRISYSAIEKQTDLIMANIYELPEYIPNITKIIFAGFPNDLVVRSRLGIYYYAIGLPDNVAYWDGWGGIRNNRRMYLLNYYGIEAGYFTQEDYLAVINSDEFDKMPLWPQKGSVKMINDMVVVKLSNMPPLKEDTTK